MRFPINQRQKSNFIVGLAITNCVIIISLLAQYIDCLQQQQQQPQQQQSQQEQITALQQQQQQQLDQLVNNHSNEHATNTNNNNNNNKPPRHQKVKSNHRLVSKLKDARHRRRHRHHRHRHYHSQTAASLAAAASGVAASAGSPAGSQQSPGNPFGSLIQEQPVAHTASSTALTALESIVEEVARAGAQIPLSAAAAVAASAIQQQHQREQVAPPVQPSSSVMSGPELLLDGGSSPVSSIQQQQQQPALTAPNSSQAQPGNPNVASASSPSTQTTTTTTSTSTSLSGPAPTPHLTRGPLHNTRNLLLTSTLSKIYNLLNVTEFALEMRDGISSRASCVACNAVVGLFLSPLYSKEVFSAAIRTVCTSFKIQTARVCAGLVESFQDDFEYIRKNTKLTRDEVCGVVFGVDCARRQTYNLFWTVPIPEMPKNIAILNNQNANNINNQNENTNNNNNNNNYDKQQDSPNGPQQPPITIPLSEHQMTNMDDAPDLFEYRKSNVVMAASASQTSASPQVVAMPAQSSSSQSSAQSTSSSSSSPSSASSPSLTTGGLSTGQKSQLKADNNGKQAAGEPSAPSPDNSNASGDLLLTPSNKHQASQQQQQQHQVNNKKTKMLKRPQYIFDDDQLDNQHQHLQQDGQLQQQSQFNRQHRQQVSSFVHITDIHIDPYYEAGSLNECHEPLCCRATSGPVALNDKRRQAGRWGDYGNCDVPVRTLRNALERIREQHSDAEYWLWTGDISPHDIWNISKAESANHVRLVTKMVRQYSNGLPVFPVIGNHEAHPVNSFSPPEIKGKFSMSWLYDLLADEWSEWLPSDALKTLRMGGFYKLQVRKGFRIIALNTNYCARLNPWSFYDPVDPANQLKWLVEELLEAELNQDKVHIIGHVPPDNRECTQAWLFNFINIIDRFKDTIIAQFYGHTHRDEWRVVYSLAKHEEPIGIQYIGPSITPFTENNPSYRIYHQDKQGNILDSETYYFNLTEANETPTSEPNWRFSYSARAHLNMTQGLTASQWHQYLQRLHDDDQLFDMFYKNFYRFSDVKTDSVCKNKCRFQMLSDLRLSHPYKTKPKPFLANRKTSNHHRDRHDHHHHHHKRLRHSE